MGKKKALEALTDTAKAALTEGGLTRRSFLKGAAATGVGATALGAGALKFAPKMIDRYPHAAEIMDTIISQEATKMTPGTAFEILSQFRPKGVELIDTARKHQKESLAKQGLELDEFGSVDDFYEGVRPEWGKVVDEWAVIRDPSLQESGLWETYDPDFYWSTLDDYGTFLTKKFDETRDPQYAEEAQRVLDQHRWQKDSDVPTVARMRDLAEKRQPDTELTSMTDTYKQGRKTDPNYRTLDAILDYMKQNPDKK